MRSDSSAQRNWATVEDVWKNLSTPPRAPRPVDYATPELSGVNMAAVGRARRSADSIGVRESRAGGAPITRSIPKVDPGYDTSGDRRLWRMAGGLMIVAVCVLGVLGWLSFSPAPATVVAALPQPAPAEAPREAAAAPKPIPPASPAARVSPSTTAPARPSVEKSSRKHGKHKSHHKRARLAKRR